MSNMEYCRFQNTLNDLRDCWNHMEEALSEKETKAKERLVKLCCRIAENYVEEEEEE